MTCNSEDNTVKDRYTISYRCFGSHPDTYIVVDHAVDHADDLQ